MHLTALVESRDHVCCRYRLDAFRPYLEQAGYRLELCPLPRNWWSRIGLLRGLASRDGVILQRKLLQPGQLYFLRRAARRLIFDFDDALFLRDSYSVRGLQSARRRRRFLATVRAADAVVAGNVYLRQQALAGCDEDRVHVVPTCVEPSRYPLAKHRSRGEGVQLVWIGSSSTLRGLSAIRSILEQIGRRWRGIGLKLISNQFFQLNHLRVIPCPWSEATEAAELARADIGISWLPNDDWSRGKCGLKVLQYMAAGLPVVANPVGVQAELVRHAETGFLVETPQQWLEAIGQLARDPSLRQHMGQSGRRRVESGYSVAAGAARWIALLEKLKRRKAA